MAVDASCTARKSLGQEKVRGDLHSKKRMRQLGMGGHSAREKAHTLHFFPFALNGAP